MRIYLTSIAWLGLAFFCLNQTVYSASTALVETVSSTQGAVGDFVWNDLNKNGRQDVGEPGVDDIELILLDSIQNEISRTFSQDGGAYVFKGLTPGKYYIKLGDHDDFKPTIPYYANNDINSDIDILFKKTSAIFVYDESIIEDVDIGLYEIHQDTGGLSSIGDLVWEDANQNGLQDAGESGISGIELILFDRSRNEIKRTISDANGFYVFDSLAVGQYYVQLVPSSPYVPTRSDFTQSDRNSDIDHLFLKTSMITLDADEYRDDIDVGLFRPAAIEGFIWNDTNSDCTFDVSESFAKRLKVELLDRELEIVKTTYSQEDGSFGFGSIPPATYFVRLSDVDHVELCWLDRSSFTIFSQLDADKVIGPFDLSSNEVLDELNLAIQPVVDCSWTIDIIESKRPDCTGRNGFILIDMSDTDRSYSISWSTGSDANFLSDLSEGIYTVVVTDERGCENSLSISMFKSDEECDSRKDQVELNLYLYLEGAYEDGMMSNHMRERGYLPGMKPKTIFGKLTPAGHPYSGAPWYYQGAEGDEGDFEEFYPTTTVDWVLVSLRTDINVDSEVYRRAGLLQSDGKIMFVKGFDKAEIDIHEDYYIVVEHRNHIMVMSPIPMPVYDNTLSFDFRNDQSFTGLLGHGQKQLEDGAYAMYAGNIDHVGYGHSDLNYTDLRTFFVNNGLHSSYYLADIDLNGDINVNDRKMLLDNMGVFSTVSH